MNIMKKMMLVTASAGLVFAGTANAEIRSAQAVPSSVVRASAPVGEASELRGGSSWLLGLLAAAAVIGGIIILADGDDEADSVG